MPTADAKGVVSFEVGGTTYRLNFNVNAMIEAEAAFGGRNITQIGQMLSGGASAQGIREQFGLVLAQRDDAADILAAIAPAIEYAAAASVVPGEGPSLTNLRTLFRCGLVDSHPEMTDREAGTLMGELGLQEAGDLVATAFNAANARKETKGRKSPPAKGAS